jgi:hypothetical protein
MLKTVRSIAALAAAFSLSLSATAATHRHNARRAHSTYHRAYVDPAYMLPLWRQPCFSLDDCDRKRFDESGTRGRMGLGADPAHPEGPGNFSD